MESYVIRIYRREAPDEVAGLLIDSRDGSRRVFHNAEQLTSCLALGDGEAISASSGKDPIGGEN